MVYPFLHNHDRLGEQAFGQRHRSVKMQLKKVPHPYLLISLKPTTGLVIFSFTHSAASSSAVPPISPIITTAYVSGSSLKAFNTSINLVPFTGSPPIPMAWD